MKKHVPCIVALLTVLLSTIAWGADLEMVVTPPRIPITSGETVVLDLVLLNHDHATITHDLPGTLSCRIDTGRTTATVEAVLVNAEEATPVTIPGRGYAKRQYTLTLPVYATGNVVLELNGVGTHRLPLTVEKATPEAWAGQQVPLDEGPTMLQSFLGYLGVYQPMYFLLGVAPGLEQSKYQFSFQYRLFNPQGYLAEQAPWITGFRLGYTQRSIWDLKNESKPFEDTGYMPEIFYLWPNIDLDIDRISAFGIQSGAQHHSNGEGGDESRSTNYLYLKPIMGVHLAGPYHLKIAPKLFTYVGNDNETNPDIADYFGHVDLEVGVIDPEGLALNAHLWWAKKGASVELDLTYSMARLLGKSFNVYLQAQYFNGYTEALIRYDERHDAFRLGFAIVR